MAESRLVGQDGGEKKNLLEEGIPNLSIYFFQRKRFYEEC